jgi:hypothetical protein
MLYISSSIPSATPDNDDKRQLARLRRAAKPRGFRILKDWSGRWSLIDSRVAPPRALHGLLDVSLAEIETALSAPLPPPKIRTRKAAASGSPEVDAILQKLRELTP